MSDSPINILSTRPIDGALVEKAAYQNITIHTLPFIEIKKLATPEVIDEVAVLARKKVTVVFTSMNAVELVVEVLPVHPKMPDWKIYCLGGATFTLVKKYWPYDCIQFTARNATDLATKIIEDKVQDITFFCGNKRREELPVLLEQQGVKIDEVVVYETLETPTIIDRDYDGILFFSPSAVHSFFSNNNISSTTNLFAIGNTTADAIKQFSTNTIIVSEFPAKDQLVDKAINFYKH